MDKLQRLIQATTEWASRKKCTRKELQSLIGTLQHAATVIRPGRSFCRRAINLLKGTKHQYYIHLNTQFRADMLWWKSFADCWNGSSLIISTSSKIVSFTSDASGSWGCGAWHGNRWFQLQWDSHCRLLHIAAKELIPVIITAVVWGKEWRGCRVVANSDNSAVVEVLNSRCCQDQALMQMLRCLFFIEAKGQFYIEAKHVPGVDNELADDLSRDNLSSFLAKKPSAEPTSTVIPVSLLQWLLHPNLEWTSPVWMRLFNIFVRTE